MERRPKYVYPGPILYATCGGCGRFDPVESGNVEIPGSALCHPCTRAWEREADEREAKRRARICDECGTGYRVPWGEGAIACTDCDALELSGGWG